MPLNSLNLRSFHELFKGIPSPTTVLNYSLFLFKCPNSLISRTRLHLALPALSQTATSSDHIIKRFHAIQSENTGERINCLAVWRERVTTIKRFFLLTACLFDACSRVALFVFRCSAPHAMWTRTKRQGRFKFVIIMLRKLLAFYCHDASQSTDGCLCGLSARDDEINKFITEMKFRRSRWIFRRGSLGRFFAFP